MALVLRKAVMPKNVSLLKCIKGRPLATATNKKNVAPLSSAGARRTYKSKFIPTALTKIRRVKQFVPIEFHSTRTKTNPVWVSVSCSKIDSNPKQTSLTSFSSNALSVNSSRSLTQIAQRRSYSKVCSAGCPCPFPCGPCGCKDGCNCLPPPCNTPPRCIQYMTGYYYYPYGTWFCGPYHVQGTCCPVGSKCPCPSPCPCPKCTCVFPTANLGTATKSDQRLRQPNVRIYSYEQPQPNKVPSGTGITKIFNFNTPEQKDNKEDPKPTKKNVPPVLASMICPYISPLSSSHLPHPNIKCSYPSSYNKSKSNSYHTRATLASLKHSYESSNIATRKGRYIFYQKRYRATKPPRFDKVSREPVSKQGLFNYNSLPRYKRFDSKPHVDTDFKPFDL